MIPPEIIQLFDQYAFELIGKGFKRFSADAILHRIRWYEVVERGNRQYKCNNNWTSVLARRFIDLHPQHADFFELREKQKEAA